MCGTTEQAAAGEASSGLALVLAASVLLPMAHSRGTIHRLDTGANRSPGKPWESVRGTWRQTRCWLLRPPCCRRSRTRCTGAHSRRRTPQTRKRDYLRVAIEYPLSPCGGRTVAPVAAGIARGDRNSALRHLDRLVRDHPTGRNVGRASFWTAESRSAPVIHCVRARLRQHARSSRRGCGDAQSGGVLHAAVLLSCCGSATV
jgi:hypothetical protein